MATDPELEAEQAYIDRAYGHMERMRQKVLSLDGGAAASEWTDAETMEYELDRRARSLTDDGRALCFGRIDETEGEGGHTWYVGRRHIENEAADPVIVEWRAPIAVPFYRANHFHSMGLARRRQFTVEGRHLLGLSDEDFSQALGEGGVDTIRARDALIHELDRDRTGEMRDIVATIQAEQDELIRSPLAGILVVQGGPGTGKTAVGLHRAAFLLYGNEALERAGVLVIGPNRTFLRYIAQVLPSLDVEAAAQLTCRDLVPGVRLRAIDRSATMRLKGDARMAPVLARAVDVRRGKVEGDLEMRIEESRRLALTAEDANRIAGDLAARRPPYLRGREILRDRLLDHLYAQYSSRYGGVGDAVDPRNVARQVRAQPGFQAALDRLWPSLSADRVLSDLLTSAARTEVASAGILDETEQHLLVRKNAEDWAEGDLALLDEMRALLDGNPPPFGHIVVDEAQDLSPMQLRMLARRCPSGSMTVLGDIAQGTTPWAHDAWDEVVEHLPVSDEHGVRHAELLVGYRAPAQVIELASRLLPEAAPQVKPVHSVRAGSSDPRILKVAENRVIPRAVGEAAVLADEHRSVAIIVPDVLLREAQVALAKSVLDVGDAVRDGLDHGVTLVPATTAKGLEFDAVIVVEPAEIVAEVASPGAAAGSDARGLRLLYVCLTRATRHLSVVHAIPLPSALS